VSCEVEDVGLVDGSSPRRLGLEEIIEEVLFMLKQISAEDFIKR